MISRGSLGSDVDFELYVIFFLSKGFEKPLTFSSEADELFAEETQYLKVLCLEGWTALSSCEPRDRCIHLDRSCKLKHETTQKYMKISQSEGMAYEEVARANRCHWNIRSLSNVQWAILNSQELLEFAEISKHLAKCTYLRVWHTFGLLDGEMPIPL